MLFQATNISPDEAYGTGSVDLTENLEISWQVRGDSPMTAYQIDFYKNDAESTPMYSTTKVTLNAPFWGTDYKGQTQRFTAEIPSAALLAAGMGNGTDYKFVITQWWGAGSVRQSTASVFLARTTPTLTMDTIPAVIASKYASFAAVYEQEQGVPINWVRWEIAEKNSENEPFYDTGRISGTGQLKAEYDGFLTGSEYSVRCTAETATGVTVSTRWKDFSVEYAVEEASGSVTACPKNGYVLVSWTQNIRAYRYTVMRRKSGENRLVKIADVPNTTGKIRDYGVQSGEAYTYFIFTDGLGIYLTAPLTSAEVFVQYSAWSITEATEGENGQYNAERTFLFRYGTGGVNEGALSNNNTPQISKNFTRYPTRQADSARYLTGSVSGLVGEINAYKEYADSVSMADAVFALSTSRKTLFLTDPKGHFLKIHTAEAVSVQIDHKNRVMPQTATLSWVEVGSTDGISLIYADGHDFEAPDNIVFTSVSLDIETGDLVWTIPNDYTGGSVLSAAANGDLIQTADGEFTPADMEIDYATGELSAEVEYRD